LAFTPRLSHLTMYVCMYVCCPAAVSSIRSYMHAFYNSAIATDTYLSIFIGVTPHGEPNCDGKKCPTPINPGKKACDKTPVDRCTSGCPPSSDKCDGVTPPAGHSCNECNCNEKGTFCCGQGGIPDPPECGTISSGDYLSPKLILESVANFSAIVQATTRQPVFKRRLELAGIVTFVINSAVLHCAVQCV
jgi:hypothetical protein